MILQLDGFSIQSAYEATKDAISGNLEFDALLCRDDRLAIGALRAIRDMNLRVPEDIAILGWDNTQLARYSTPSLSSVAPDKVEIAKTALAMLKERIEGYEGPGRKHFVKFTIASRQST